MRKLILLAVALAACTNPLMPPGPLTFNPPAAPSAPIVTNPQNPGAPRETNPAGLIVEGPDSLFVEGVIHLAQGQTGTVRGFFRFDRELTLSILVFQEAAYCGTTGQGGNVKGLRLSDEWSLALVGACNVFGKIVTLPPNGGRRDIEIPVKAALRGESGFRTRFELQGYAHDTAFRWEIPTRVIVR